MAHLLGSLAAAAARNWKRSVAIVLAVFVVIGVLAGAFGGEFSDDFKTPGTESQQAYDVLQQRFPSAAGDTATVVFSVASGTLRDGNRPATIRSTVAEIARQPDVTAAADPLRTQGQVSRDGKIAFATVQYDKRAVDLGTEAGQRLIDTTTKAAGNGLSIAQNGQVVDQAQQQSAPVGEIVGIAVAVIVLTLVFHSAAAMVLTLVSALIALGVGLLLLTVGARFADFPSFAPTLGIMLGLGAGIDYALLIVGRYREQLAAGDSVPHAARVANSTAGVSVVAAGLIVVVAIAGLLATGIPFVGRMGIGSAIVVACVAVGAVTVLPTFMGAFAKRLRPKDPSHTAPSEAFARWGGVLTRRPWVAAGVGTLLLLVLAYPATQLRLGQPDDGNDGADTTTRMAYDKLAEGFGPGFNGPLLLAADVPSANASASRATLTRVQQAVSRTKGVQVATPPRMNPAGTAAIISVIPTTSPQDEGTSELVDRLRDSTIPAATRGSDVRVHVGGATATFEDLGAKIAERLPIFIALVVGLSILLLMAVFRSIWVPLVSAVFNLLSIAAAYGVVVAVFQWGWGASVFGSEGDLPIVSFVPLFMFAILFGLSMDYNVFLSSRIREEAKRGRAPADSVIVGMSRVGKVILAAGTIMFAVFLGFVSGDDIIIKLIGFGLASAIAIDVLIVRMVVAPAVITLLGDKAWWMPAWLDRILPTISLEGDLVDDEPDADREGTSDRPAVTA